MTQQETLTTERMDGPAALRAADAFRLVYAEAFAEPPHNETEEEVADAFLHFPAQTRRPAFRAALARTPDGEPAGVAYGWTLQPDAVWWDELTKPASAAMRREDGRRTFGLIELAVRGPWRGQGVARRLHTALLDGITAERVLLKVHQEAGTASAAYRSWGYRKIGEARPPGADAGADTDLRDVMLLDLRR
ncbi:GNAT family N-acetyltransferase [Streptomyces sp. NBC_00335]|uniref:GNAT family N-acetyltransferase n=1 Tax=unclassified Streptomyces TaxID=2593676 RepID=UPI002258D9F3|nr:MULTISPECIES: GNAT family N-acetyltransferase [unclassified Streptomyces]MCX5405893.1 GNAT family N-acetyltransferase [Streptomyces sp. NBC_00086]